MIAKVCDRESRRDTWFENRLVGVSAQGVRQKISFSTRHGGASLRTGTSKTPVSAHGNLRNSVLGVSAHAVRQKTSFPIRTVCFCDESFNDYNL